MKNSQFNIDNYLTEAEENFSGFYGDGMYDYAQMDGSFAYEWNNAEGDMPAANLKSPSPYQVTVTNSTAGTLNAVLFGRNEFLLTANFGSDAGITVAPSQANVSYLELLEQSAEQPFETSLVRIQSTNTTQITQILTVTVKDANGQAATLPIITQSYFSAYQQQSGILDVPYNLKIDANTKVTFPVLGTTTVIMTFFPAEKVNVAKGLNGRPAVSVYGNPQVNLGGMTFPKRPEALRPVARLPRG